VPDDGYEPKHAAHHFMALKCCVWQYTSYFDTGPGLHPSSYSFPLRLDPCTTVPYSCITVRQAWPDSTLS